uniref:Uncharacterized protein n=1 Tax=Strongyloides venezuelensis TaxID=75913 RepID=A0A0K0FW72_STRVS
MEISLSRTNMMKKAEFDVLIDTLRKNQLLTDKIQDTVNDYWNREEHEAAHNIVNNIILQLKTSPPTKTKNFKDYDTTDDASMTHIIYSKHHYSTKQEDKGAVENNGTRKRPNFTPLQYQSQKLTCLFDKLPPFMANTSAKFKTWFQQYELAVAIAHSTDNKEQRACHFMRHKEDYKETISYILQLINLPINQLRANFERL